jgi:hypothetical protein
MNSEAKGYLFALPRLLARLCGHEVRRAEWSRGEIYSFGVFVFCFACVVAARSLWPFVRPISLRTLFFLLLPLVVWIAFLLLYFLNWLLAEMLRPPRLYSATTNNPLQHFVIISLFSFLALLLLRDSNVVMKSLGAFWLGLVGLNLLAFVLLKFLPPRKIHH